jgi:hypothetical protein
MTKHERQMTKECLNLEAAFCACEIAYSEHLSRFCHVEQSRRIF